MQIWTVGSLIIDMDKELISYGIFRFYDADGLLFKELDGVSYSEVLRRKSNTVGDTWLVLDASSPWDLRQVVPIGGKVTLTIVSSVKDTNPLLYRYNYAMSWTRGGASAIVTYDVATDVGTFRDYLNDLEAEAEATGEQRKVGIPYPGVLDGATTLDPGTVDIPADGSLPASTGISGIWQTLLAIFNAIKALPATLAAAIIGTGPLTLDAFNGITLATVFPFCIPFDLVSALTSFNATPISPVWEVDFTGSAMAAAGKVTLDLTMFGAVFAIIRFFAYAGFVVGLIVLTRRIIKG